MNGKREKGREETGLWGQRRVEKRGRRQGEGKTEKERKIEKWEVGWALLRGNIVNIPRRWS